MTTTQPTNESKTMTREERTKRVANITKALRAMKVGMCGIKFDCLVWRVSTESFAVGSTTISIDETDDIDTAASIVESFQQRAKRVERANA